HALDSVTGLLGCPLSWHPQVVPLSGFSLERSSPPRRRREKKRARRPPRPSRGAARVPERSCSTCSVAGACWPRRSGSDVRGEGRQTPVGINTTCARGSEWINKLEEASRQRLGDGPGQGPRPGPSTRPGPAGLLRGEGAPPRGRRRVGEAEAPSPRTAKAPSPALAATPGDQDSDEPEAEARLAGSPAGGELQCAPLCSERSPAAGASRSGPGRGRPAPARRQPA
ncbi:unnamed protein product, partial [Prorocentrum cordatum]